MSKNQVNVTWYGHSNVLLATDGFCAVIDPFFEGNPFAPDWRKLPKPDLVLVTHSHGDHMGQALDIVREYGSTLCCIADMADWAAGQGIARERIANFGLGWNIGGTIVEKGVSLTMTQAVHSSMLGSPVGFVLEFPDGPALYHAGDTALFNGLHLIGERHSLDLAMVPSGGVFTMDGESAARACSWMKVPYAMPLHYGTFPMLEQNTDSFVNALEVLAPTCRAMTPKPGESFTI